MKKFLLSALLGSLLMGCASGTPNPNLNQFSDYTGGRSMGDATSLYWYTEKLTSAYTASDYVTAGDYGWFKTDYRWADGELRELIREGEQIKDNTELVPYRIHVRFNKEGEAVYQQYRLDGRVLPLSKDKLAWLKQEALDIPAVTRQQDKDGYELIQGYWDGSEFETCAGNSYSAIEFNQTLPSFVVNRLSAVDNYIALLGSTRGNKVIVKELLMLAEDSQDCIERTRLIEN
ncbi:DUF1481 domain-containing protein [Vibrio sinaloensis]|nr:DUF1481 domain-containing protein [Vibrio sinaloensis]